MDSCRRIRAGYAFSPKKQRELVTPSLLSYAAERSVDLVRIDPARGLSDQGPFDCVLHKLYDDDWCSQLRDYAVLNPGVPIIDSPEAILRTHDRVSMLEVASEFKVPLVKETLGVPEQVVITNRETLSDPNTLASLRFPVIVKPLLSNGSASAHCMSLSFNRKALLQLKLETPVVLQEFVNHGGVVFKVYVLGDHVECVKRASLPDVAEDDPLHHEGLIPFSKVSDRPVSAENEERHLNDCHLPSLDFTVAVAKELSRALGLYLFNFDLIRDARDLSRYLLIDINYFPGYWKMPNYERVLIDFILDIVHKISRGDLDLLDVSGSEPQNEKMALKMHSC